MATNDETKLTQQNALADALTLSDGLQSLSLCLLSEHSCPNATDYKNPRLTDFIFVFTLTPIGAGILEAAADRIRPLLTAAELPWKRRQLRGASEQAPTPEALRSRC